MTIETGSILVGRPAIYNAELGNEICSVIASSPKGLNRLCSENEHWPEARSIYRWLKDYPEFCQQYARAKRLQIEALVDEMLEIADTSSNDYTINMEGRRVVDHEHIQRSKLRVDTRKWLASKLVPKLYGDRVRAEVVTDDSDLQRAIVEVRKLKKEVENNM